MPWILRNWQQHQPFFLSLSLSTFQELRSALGAIATSYTARESVAHSPVHRVFSVTIHRSGWVNCVYRTMFVLHQKWRIDNVRMAINLSNKLTWLCWSGCAYLFSDHLNKFITWIAPGQQATCVCVCVFEMQTVFIDAICLHQLQLAVLLSAIHYFANFLLVSPFHCLVFKSL